MNNVVKVLERVFKAAAGATGPGRYEVEGKPVRCPHCGHEAFAEGSDPFNTAGWAGRIVSTLICARCGLIEWSRQKPMRL